MPTRLLASLLAALSFFCALGLAQEPPRLIIDAPASLRSTAARIESYDSRRLETIMRLTGVSGAQEPIHLILAADDSELVRNAPAWVSGWAIGEHSVIVLIPSRAGRYPDDGLEELLRHEIAHILIWRASAGREVPRWFHEGLAMLASRGWTLEDRGRLVFGLLAADEMTLDSLERLFGEGESSATRAYAISGAFVRDLVQRHGADAPGRILRFVTRGFSFEGAFLHATGDTLLGAERRFWRSQTIWNRWLPFLTSSIALWAIVTLLALWAIRRRRLRDTAIHERWKSEEEPDEAM